MAVGQPGGKAAKDRAAELSAEIGGNVGPGEFAGRRKRNRDRWVEVRPRHMSQRGDQRHQRQPKGKRDAQQVDHAQRRGVAQPGIDGNRGPSEHQNRRPDELRRGRAHHVRRIDRAAEQTPGGLATVHHLGSQTRLG